MRVSILSIQMQYFLAVAQAGSVSAAAQRLHVAASAVSRQVAKLEDAVGDELFHRRQRGMRLTEAGERLAVHLAGVSAEGERVLNRVKSLPASGGQIVRLACTDGFATGLVPPVIERFRSEHAGAQVHLSIVSPEDAGRMLQHDQVDLVLKYSAAPERRSTELYSELAPLYALMQPDHPLARRRSLTLAEVVRHPLVIAAQGMTVRQLFDLACSQKGLSYEAAIISNRVSAMLPLVRGHDIALAGLLTASSWTGQNVLVAKKFVAGELPLRRLRLLSSPAGRLSPWVEAFAKGVIGAIRGRGSRR